MKNSVRTGNRSTGRTAGAGTSETKTTIQSQTEDTSVVHPTAYELEIAQHVATLAYQMAGRLLHLVVVSLDNYALDPCVGKVRAAILQVLLDEFHGPTPNKTVLEGLRNIGAPPS